MRFEIKSGKFYLYLCQGELIFFHLCEDGNEIEDFIIQYLERMYEILKNTEGFVDADTITIFTEKIFPRFVLAYSIAVMKYGMKKEKDFPSMYKPIIKKLVRRNKKNLIYDNRPYYSNIEKQVINYLKKNKKEDDLNDKFNNNISEECEKIEEDFNNNLYNNIENDNDHDEKGKDKLISDDNPFSALLFEEILEVSDDDRVEEDVDTSNFNEGYELLPKYMAGIELPKPDKYGCVFLPMDICLDQYKELPEKTAKGLSMMEFVDRPEIHFISPGNEGYNSKYSITRFGSVIETIDDLSDYHELLSTLSDGCGFSYAELMFDIDEDIESVAILNTLCSSSNDPLPAGWCYSLLVAAHQRFEILSDFNPVLDYNALCNVSYTYLISNKPVYWFINESGLNHFSFGKNIRLNKFGFVGVLQPSLIYALLEISFTVDWTFRQYSIDLIEKYFSDPKKFSNFKLKFCAIFQPFYQKYVSREEDFKIDFSLYKRFYLDDNIMQVIMSYFRDFTYIL